jgi:predicted dithiol-disulfide oxidoreductase (DUF899 family)
MAKAKRKTQVKAKAKPKSKSSAKHKSAAKALHKKHFPNESSSYRSARDNLLKAEIELRRQVEKVAAQRRKLPSGGGVPQDYEFEEGAEDLNDQQTVRKVRMSDLFKRDASLAVYSYMYGPQMANPCPMCTSIVDALNATAQHAGQRINLVVVAKSPIQRLRQFARERGWRNLRLLSSANNSYNSDYFGEDEKGSQNPALNVFTRKNGAISHAWASELMFAPADAGQNPRHVDMMWPLWNLFDFTPEGRGSNWFPKLAYES